MSAETARTQVLHDQFASHSNCAVRNYKMQNTEWINHYHRIHFNGCFLGETGLDSSASVSS